LRTGIGFDAHRLVADRTLVLGGVTIPNPLGLLGHSDGDVLLHAVMDALLGAAGLGDMGKYFPSSDTRFQGASSIQLLSMVRDLLISQQWRVINLDATIVAEGPILSPYICYMQQRISDSLSLEFSRVNVKAKTTDGMGFTGRGEGMIAYAVVSLEKAE